MGRRDAPTWAVPLVEGGLVPPGWGNLRVSQEGAVNSQEFVGGSHPSTLPVGWLALGCLESRACFAASG